MIITGDSLKILPTLPPESVQCCVTSPPYWGLRDYGIEPTVWPDGWVGCFGLEPNPELYVQHSVLIFSEVRRVLRMDGILWLNLGDSYANDTKWGGTSGGKNSTSAAGGYRGQLWQDENRVKDRDITIRRQGDHVERILPWYDWRGWLRSGPDQRRIFDHGDE